MNYLYNGVELPELPEWDKETYPYCVIDKGFVQIEGEYLFKPILRVSSEEFYIGGTSSDSITISLGVVGISRLVADSGNAWEELSFLEEAEYWKSGNTIFYANHDVYYRSQEFGELYNTVCVAKSDPIPVSSFTPDPISMTMGWLVGRRIAGQRNK